MQPLFVRALLHRRDVIELNARIDDVEQQYDLARQDALAVRRERLKSFPTGGDKETRRLFRVEVHEKYLESLHGVEIDRQEAKYDLLYCITKYMRNEANILLIPMPSAVNQNEFWIEDYGPPCLNLAGIAKLRSEIRREYKERFEIYQSRAALVLGLIGTVLGVLSFFKR